MTSVCACARACPIDHPLNPRLTAARVPTLPYSAFRSWDTSRASGARASCAASRLPARCCWCCSRCDPKGGGRWWGGVGGRWKVVGPGGWSLAISWCTLPLPAVSPRCIHEACLSVGAVLLVLLKPVPLVLLVLCRAAGAAGAAQARTAGAAGAASCCWCCASPCRWCCWCSAVLLVLLVLRKRVPLVLLVLRRAAGAAQARAAGAAAHPAGAAQARAADAAGAVQHDFCLCTCQPARAPQGACVHVCRQAGRLAGRQVWGLQSRPDAVWHARSVLSTL
eukprot:365805-Chlamydomonas_euryale.AAC.1